MSTVLVFNPVSDLAGAQTGNEQVTLTWSTATPIYTFVNGDAETGDNSGWTVTVGSLFARVSGSTGLVPPQGNYSFDCGQGNASTKAFQRISPLSEGLLIDDVDDGAHDLTVNWWGGRFDQSPGDQPQLNVYCYDASGALLLTHNSGFKNPTTLMGSYLWSQYVDVVTMPVGTRFVDIEMEGKRNAGGSQSYNDAAFDDIRFSFEGAETTPFVPGYAIYQDGVLVALATPNATQIIVENVPIGAHTFQVIVCDSPNYLYDDDSINFLSDASNTIDVTITSPNESQSYALFGFDDEQIYTGYLGGRLSGTTIACPGENANKVKPCC